VLPGTPLHWPIHLNLKEVQSKSAALCYTKLFVGACKKMYVVISDHIFQRYSSGGDAFVFISVFEKKVSCLSIFYTVSLYVSTRLVRNFSTFVVYHHAKVNPPVRCVSAANVVCRYTDIFNIVLFFNRY
jgi:hypothetical protein